MTVELGGCWAAVVDRLPKRCYHPFALYVLSNRIAQTEPKGKLRGVLAVTQKEVAKLANVSTTTVSYVINSGPRPVSEETRRRVLWAIERLGYRPNASARSLKTKRTQTIGIIISDILNLILASIEKNVEDLLLADNCSLITCNSDESPERERMWLNMLLERGVDGIILLPTGENRTLLHSIVGLGGKIVLIDRQVAGLDADCVMFDNEAGAYQAVTHLIEKGHKRIGLINLPSSLTMGIERLRGYEHALHDAGLPRTPELVRETTTKAASAELLTADLLDSEVPPTAILASSNRIAQGVLLEARRRGLQLPRDLALCCFDDVPFFQLTTPTITAVSADLREFAIKAVEFLTDRIGGTYSGAPRTALIKCDLRPRESTNSGPT